LNGTSISQFEPPAQKLASDDLTEVISIEAFLKMMSKINELEQRNIELERRNIESERRNIESERKNLELEQRCSALERAVNDR